MPRGQISASPLSSTSVLAALVGFEKDRAFYPTLLVVIASYYVLLALRGRSAHAIVVEALVMAGFTAAAIIGFKMNLWLVVAALAAHGIFDFVHGPVVSNPGVPSWWPPFCLAYDVTAAGFLAWLLKRAHSALQATVRTSTAGA